MKNSLQPVFCLTDLQPQPSTLSCCSGYKIFATSTLYLVLLFRLQNICNLNPLPCPAVQVTKYSLLNQLQHPDIPTIDHFLSYQILIILLRTENFSLRLNKKIKNGFLIFHKCKIVVGQLQLMVDKNIFCFKYI